MAFSTKMIRGSKKSPEVISEGDFRIGMFEFDTKPQKLEELKSYGSGERFYSLIQGNLPQGFDALAKGIQTGVAQKAQSTRQEIKDEQVAKRKRNFAELNAKISALVAHEFANLGITSVSVQFGSEVVRVDEGSILLRVILQNETRDLLFKVPGLFHKKPQSAAVAKELEERVVENLRSLLELPPASQEVSEVRSAVWNAWLDAFLFDKEPNAPWNQELITLLDLSELRASIAQGLRFVPTEQRQLFLRHVGYLLFDADRIVGGEKTMGGQLYEEDGKVYYGHPVPSQFRGAWRRERWKKPVSPLMYRIMKDFQKHLQGGILPPQQP
ncbi:MAG: hypothetical protein R3C68_00895 [Myxococcota bacterium]